MVKRSLYPYSRRPTQQTGVTLVELVICIVIISIAMVAVLNSFSVSMTHSADPLWRNKSLKLAQLYLDEILAKNYDHTTPIGGQLYVASPSCAALGPDIDIVSGILETRTTFNDVDDYHGLNDAPPISLVGSLNSTYDDYRVSVVVECDGDTVGATGTGSDTQAKKITVTVTPPGQSAMDFGVYKGNY